MVSRKMAYSRHVNSGGSLMSSVDSKDFVTANSAPRGARAPPMSDWRCRSVRPRIGPALRPFNFGGYDYHNTRFCKRRDRLAIGQSRIFHPASALASRRDRQRQVAGSLAGHIEARPERFLELSLKSPKTSRPPSWPATFNRDASLIFYDQEIATYFDGFFEYDWERSRDADAF